MSLLISPFQHRENLINFLLLSDLLIFLATISWMEFSQSIFSENHDALSVLYRISPLSLFTHDCDSYFTYIWILLFNLSTLIALTIVVLCIYAVHQTSFEPSCILFLLCTLIAFISVSTFPIIAFISFFKLSIFVLSSLVQSNINIIPAIYSKYVCFPVRDNLNCPHSDLFYQKLYQFIYSNHEYGKYNYTNFNFNMLFTLFTTLLIPIFAFFDCETVNSSKKIKWKDRQIINKRNMNKDIENTDNEYELRVGIANKVLAEHYSDSFWIPFNLKYVAQKIIDTPYSECTTNFMRELRGYTVKNIFYSILQSFNIFVTDDENDESDDYQLTFYDQMIQIQYMVILFVFIPLQTIFAIYGLIYPYIVGYQIITDLYYFHGYGDNHNYIVQNQVIETLFDSILSSSQSIWCSFHLLLRYWYFCIFLLCLIGHFMAMISILRKVWKLRYLFEMCLNVLIIHDNSMLDQKLITKMTELRTNINATQVRDQELENLFGRYHLDKLIIQYAGNMHECDYHTDTN